MADLLRINLNKGESRTTRMERIKERGRWILFSVLIVVLVGLTAGALHYNHRMGNIIAERQQRVTEVKQKIQALKQEGVNLSKADILSLDRLEKSRVFWARKLQALAANVATDMSLTEITFRHGRFTISGITRIYPGEREFDIVNDFTRQLQNDPVIDHEFGRVKLLSYSREKIHSQQIVTFEIEAELPHKRAAEPLR